MCARQLKHCSKYRKKNKNKKLASQIRSTQTVPMLNLDYKAFVMKTGAELKPLQNTAINDALASHNNFNAIVSVFVKDYRQIKLNAI